MTYEMLEKIESVDRDNRRLPLDELFRDFSANVQIFVVRNNRSRNPRILETVWEIGFKTAGRTTQVRSSIDIERAFAALQTWVANYTPEKRIKEETC